MAQHTKPLATLARGSAILASMSVGFAVLGTSLHAQDQQPATQLAAPPDLLSVEAEPSAPANGARGETTPTFDQLDSAASDLNSALAGARAKLAELRQATELAAMAAQLREELETSIQENNRLATALAEVQEDKKRLDMEQKAAQRRIGELTKEVDEAKSRIAALDEQLARSREATQAAELARVDREAEIGRLQTDLDTSRRDSSDLRTEVANLGDQLESTRNDLEDATIQAEDARQERDAANEELSRTRKQIAGMLRSVLLGGEPIDVSALENGQMASQDPNGATGMAIAATGLYQAVRASNIRAEPHPDATRVGFAEAGDTVMVLEKVEGVNWFRVETEDGTQGFIFGELISPKA